MPTFDINNLDDFRAYIDDNIKPNAVRSIKGGPHNTIENTLVDLVEQSPLNAGLIDILTNGGVVNLSKTYSYFSTTAPTQVNFSSNIHKEWLIINDLPTVLTLGPTSHYFDQGIEKATIPARTTVRIAKANNGQWLKISTTDVDPNKVSGYSGYSGNSGFSGKSGYSGFGVSGFSGYSGFGLSGFSGYSGFGLSGFSGYSGAGFSGYSGFSGNSTSGYSGFSGGSGFSGYSGISGYSGRSGFSGYSGATVSGFSGYSGAGLSGFSGYSGKSGYSGFSGNSTSGYSGYSGNTGPGGGDSGFSGYSGTSTSGFSGYSGYSGFSGFSGYSGKSGYSGFSGTNGSSGFSGYSGFGISGFSGYSGNSTSGFSGYSGTNGTSGFSGYSGKSGYSGLSGYSGNSTSGYSGYSGLTTNMYLGPEFVGTGLDSSNRIYIDLSQITNGALVAARYGAGTIPVGAMNATGGSTGKVLSYDGTWVANGGNNIQMTADGVGFTVTPPVASGYNANVMTLGTNATYHFVNELKSGQRFDIIAAGSEIWLRADNIYTEGNAATVQYLSGNATSVASQVDSYSHVMRSSMWDTGTSSNYLSFAGMKVIASTTAAGVGRITFKGNSTNGNLSDGNLLISFLTTGTPVYANDAAAGTGGLVTGDAYVTSTGVLMRKN